MFVSSLFEDFKEAKSFFWLPNVDAHFISVLISENMHSSNHLRLLHGKHTWVWTTGSVVHTHVCSHTQLPPTSTPAVRGSWSTQRELTHAHTL